MTYDSLTRDIVFLSLLLLTSYFTIYKKVKATIFKPLLVNKSISNLTHAEVLYQYKLIFRLNGLQQHSGHCIDVFEVEFNNVAFFFQPTVLWVKEGRQKQISTARFY